MATDEFGGIAIDEPKPQTDQFGGIAIGDAPTPSPPISGHETFLPNLVSDDAKPFVNSTTTGGIMKAFGHEFGQAFGSEQLGLSPEGTKWLSKIGIFAPEGQEKYQNPFQAFNEGVLVNTAAFLDGAIRAAGGIFRGGQAATMEALGGGQFGREIAALPEAFMGSPGSLGKVEMRPGLPPVSSPNLEAGFHGTPTGELKPNGPYFFSPHEDVAKNYSLASEDQTLAAMRGEKVDLSGNNPKVIAAGLKMERPFEADVNDLENAGHVRDPGWLRDNGYDSAILRDKDDPKGTEFVVLDQSQIITKPAIDIGQAKDLGVIGEDKPRLADLSDKPVSEVVDTLRPKQDGAPEATPAQDGGWRDRFDHYVGKLTQPEEIRQLIRDSADENNNFPGARAPAEPLSLSEAQNLADAAGMDLGEVDRAKLGKQFNEAHVDRAMQVMIQSTRNVKDAARDVISDASEENLIKFQEHLLRRDMAVEEIVGIRSTWGRIGNTLNKYVTEVKDGKALDSFIKETCPL